MAAPSVRPPPAFAITSGTQQLPSKAIFYGVPGIGKTPVAAQAPKPVFAMTHGENGIETLIDNGIVAPTDHFPEARDWQTLLKQLEYLLANDTGHKTFVLDTLNGAESLCFTAVTNRDFGGDRSKFDSYGKGPAIAIPEWSRLVHLMHRLNAERKMAIIAIAHSRTKSYKNPSGDDYDRFGADMHEKTWAVCEKWSDLCLFMNYETFAKKEQGQLRAKAHSTGARFLYTQRTAAFDAKNRFNLPAEIQMGSSPQQAWQNLTMAIRAARQANGAPVNGKRPHSELPGDIIMQPQTETTTETQEQESAS